MNAFTDQFSAATASAKSQIESQLNLASHYASTAFEGVQQVIALNFSTTRASVEKSSAVARQFLEARDPRDFIVQAPDLENLLSYSRELYNITSKTQAELLQLVKDQFKEATATAAAVAAKPLALAAKVATPAAAPVHNEPAEAEVAGTPAAAPAAPKIVKPEAKAEVKAEAKPEIKAEAKAEAKGKPAAKPLADAVAELSGGHVAEESKPVAAVVPPESTEAKPVVLKSVSPKK